MFLYTGYVPDTRTVTKERMNRTVMLMKVPHTLAHITTVKRSITTLERYQY